MKHKLKSSYDPRWSLSYSELKPEEEKLRETLCTVGNGYFGTRACFEGERASDNHYPGTYFAGLFNRIPSEVHGKQIYNADFVNCPNWLLTEIKIGNGGYRSLLDMEILSYEQHLNMRDGLMSRSLSVKDRKGRITKVESRLIASMANHHYAALRYSLIPVNYSDQITVRTSLDGTVVNDGVPRYRGLNNKHLTPVRQGALDDGIMLVVETTQSHVQIAYCAKNIFYEDSTRTAVKRSVRSDPGFVSELLTFKAEEGSVYTIDKLVCMFTSRDENTASPLDAARAGVAQMSSFYALFKKHQSAWRALWNDADMRIHGDEFAQKVIRLHIYHLLATASPHSALIDVGVPARGLHGEAYRGHVFWDSLFILPFFYRRFPEIARTSIMYRYRRLDAARVYARENGYRGAMFPWQTADDGQEETQVIHYNPVSGKWDPDLSCRQRHVSIAIFYNIWEYYKFSDDSEFLSRYGAEMLLEIARFWASAATKDSANGRYHIRGVMGPDEFHEKYHGAKEGGLNDNAYTNLMVVWVLEKALQLMSELPHATVRRVRDRIGLADDEIKVWRKITRRMYIPITKDGIIEQFDGYMNLEDIDWEAYRSKYGNIHRMDRILKAEGDSPDKYKVAKQADVLMLFYVLSTADVFRLLRNLGYPVKNKRAFLRNNYDYYLQRTSHGSTLSKVVHAAISRDIGRPQDMWRWFVEALESDIYDTQGGTTAEGIHSGVMAGTINIISRVIAGIHFSEDEGKIDVNPALPDHWRRLTFKLLVRGRRYAFDFTAKGVAVVVDTEGESPLEIKLGKK